MLFLSSLTVEHYSEFFLTVTSLSTFEWYFVATTLCWFHEQLSSDKELWWLSAKEVKGDSKTFYEPLKMNLYSRMAQRFWTLLNWLQADSEKCTLTCPPQTGNKLEERWRDECGGSNLAELFPKDKDTEWAQRDLEGKIQQLQAFKVRLKTGRFGSWVCDVVFGWRWPSHATSPKRNPPKTRFFQALVSAGCWNMKQKLFILAFTSQDV